jgi:hypothetical protein
VVAFVWLCVWSFMVFCLFSRGVVVLLVVVGVCSGCVGLVGGVLWVGWGLV